MVPEGHLQESRSSAKPDHPSLTSGPGYDSSHTLSQEVHKDQPIRRKPERRTEILRGVCEFAGTATAGIAGAIAWGVGGAKLRSLGLAGSLGLAAGIGGIVKYTVKSGLEHLLLKPEDRDMSSADLAWGTVDGLSGVAGSVAEAAVLKRGLSYIGRRALQVRVPESLALMTGEKVVAQSLLPKLKLTLVRGMAGGAAGTFVWSVPHRLHSNWDEITNHPLAGLGKTQWDVLGDTVVGMTLSAGLAAGGTAVLNSRQLLRTGYAKATGHSKSFILDLFHFNDHHSELVGPHSLSRLVTKLKELRSKSELTGHSCQTLNAGDLESGNAAFAHTSGGYVENEAMARAGDNIRVPGNHPYDVAGGGAAVERYQGVMQQVMSDHPDVNLLAANLDLTHYPEYAKLVKPYTTIEISQSGRTDRVGIIGLVTEEGARGEIKYQDPIAAAERYISQLHNQGINKILVLSHQGLAQDITLAKRVKGITAIIGGHSHSIEPVPRWVRQGSDTMSFWQRINPFYRPASTHSGWEVPIVQAGSNGRWLGELNLCMTASGAADRVRTTGRLHAITREVPADRSIEEFISSQIGALNKMRLEQYNSEAVAPYSLSDIRRRETPLGNLVSDAISWGARKHLGTDAFDLVLTHSGSIRAGISPYEPIDKFVLSNVFINAGNRLQEGKEMLILPMTGRQLTDALEFGVSDLSAPGATRGNFFQQLQKLLGVTTASKESSQAGNFLQVSDLKYAFDLSRKPRMPYQEGTGRVSDVMFKAANASFEPITENQTYNVLTRYHEAEKWYTQGIFGDEQGFNKTLKSMGGKPVKLSRVQLTGEYIRNKTLSPNIDGKVEGRILDLTPEPWNLAVRLGTGQASFAGISAYTHQSVPQEALYQNQISP